MWNRNEWIEKAEAIKPKLNHENVYPVEQLDKRELHSGDSLILDFGDHQVGYFVFHAMTAGSHQDAPAFLKFKFCESEIELSEDSSEYHGWISRSWIQEVWMHIDVLPGVQRMLRRFAFRYVKIEVIDLSSKYSLIIDDAYVDSVSSADDSSIEVFHGTEMEERIDQIAIRTLHNCMQDVF